MRNNCANHSLVRLSALHFVNAVPHFFSVPSVFSVVPHLHS